MVQKIFKENDYNDQIQLYKYLWFKHKNFKPYATELYGKIGKVLSYYLLFNIHDRTLNDTNSKFFTALKVMKAAIYKDTEEN